MCCKHNLQAVLVCHCNREREKEKFEQHNRKLFTPGYNYEYSSTSVSPCCHCCCRCVQCFGRELYTSFDGCWYFYKSYFYTGFHFRRRLFLPRPSVLFWFRFFYVALTRVGIGLSITKWRRRQHSHHLNRNKHFENVKIEKNYSMQHLHNMLALLSHDVCAVKVLHATRQLHTAPSFHSETIMYFLHYFTVRSLCIFCTC